MQVEMAGIEPASERFNRQMSTSVVDHLISLRADGSTYLKAASRLDPKALFHAANGVAAWHSGFVSPAPRPVGGTVWADAASSGGCCASLRLCS